MAEAEPPSTSELLRLITALLVVKNPDATRHSPEDYYLNPAEGSKERTLRETVANPQFLLNPSAAWKEVRYRDWLIARLAANITDKKHDFTAISEPVLYSLDLLGKKYERGAPGVSKAIEAALLTENTKRERTLYSTLTFGISRQRTGTTDVLLLGAGMRRRVELKLNDGAAIWLLVSQVEHARISGELVRHWREEFSPDVVDAIAHHDDGWSEWENEPKLNSTGRQLARSWREHARPRAWWVAPGCSPGRTICPP